jgi:hypothetical protein
MTDSNNHNGHQENTQEQERLMVLDMLKEGKITMDEAEKLLKTLTEASPTEVEHEETSEDSKFSQAHVPPKLNIPNLERLWLYPFGIGLTSLAGSWWLFRKTGGFFGFIFFFPFVLISAIVTLVGLTSRHGHWLHVRIHDKKNVNIRISLPLPLNLSSWVLRNIVPRVEQYAEIPMKISPQTLADMIDMMGDELSPENPLVVSVDDENDKVLVYIT